jgi:hypothetical protein
MPEEGPGATFEHGMRTDIRITTPDGRASVYAFTTGILPGPYQVRVTAVKGQVRAGTVVSQYVSDKRVQSRGVSSPGTRSGKKWLIVAAIAGGVAATALGAGVGGASTNTGAQTPAAPGPVPPQIGTPTISIGGPQ